MVKTKDVNVKRTLMLKNREVNVAFSKFKDAMANLVTSGKNDEALIMLILNNLFNEITSACKAIEEREGK